MSPQIIFAILFGASGQVLGQGTLFSREQIASMNLEKNVADLEEASTGEKLLDAIGSIPTEIPLGALENSDDDEEGATSEGLDVGQNPVRTTDYSGVLAGLLVVSAAILVVLVLQLLLMVWMVKTTWLRGERSDSSHEPKEMADRV
ncbi:hypothetical protein FOZ63_031502 [Perkinsus olseni]|uniref:Uncharacterized protein n=1 Tax=Perkinsus olseni TaxID=32597 RepID=A0A7J6QUH9_PEROL|nr:hypothetical protein FOZ63_031502 [Perkinsus olseni]KAF4729343.1 hypothetical protein FOZ62_011025 [Perkinsus olseni]